MFSHSWWTKSQKKKKKEEIAAFLESFWSWEMIRRCPCWFGGSPFIAEEFYLSRVLKSLFDLACDSSFDVEFNCNWNSLGEKLFRGSWNCVGSDWVGFGLLKIRNLVPCCFPASAVNFCCQGDLGSFCEWFGQITCPICPNRFLGSSPVSVSVSASDLASSCEWFGQITQTQSLFQLFLHFFSIFPISSFSAKTWQKHKLS